MKTQHFKRDAILKMTIYAQFALCTRQNGRIPSNSVYGEC